MDEDYSPGWSVNKLMAGGSTKAGNTAVTKKPEETTAAPATEKPLVKGRPGPGLSFNEDANADEWLKIGNLYKRVSTLGGEELQIIKPSAPVAGTGGFVATGPTEIINGPMNVVAGKGEGLDFGFAFLGAAVDFISNYNDMRQLNWRNSDKYFHAKANFEAAGRGAGGAFFAEHFSNLREIWDQNVKGYPKSDSRLDQAANTFGRRQSMQYYKNEYLQALIKYRPTNLPKGY